MFVMDVVDDHVVVVTPTKRKRRLTARSNALGRPGFDGNQETTVVFSLFFFKMSLHSTVLDVIYVSFFSRERFQAKEGFFFNIFFFPRRCRKTLPATPVARPPCGINRIKNRSHPDILSY